MKIFALGDLHLSEAVDKPMQVFGHRWDNHTGKIINNWNDCVGNDDIVIVPGDISWGLKLDEAVPDLQLVDKLPGRKVFIKGNHDLWWNSVSKLNGMFDKIFFLQNTFYPAGDTAICGTRGWMLPEIAENWTAHDEKIFKREILRLQLSLDSATKAGYTQIIAAMHFPPTNRCGNDTVFTELLEKYHVKHVIYGHLHGEDAAKNAFTGTKHNISYRLVASDSLNFKPIQII